MKSNSNKPVKKEGKNKANKIIVFQLIAWFFAVSHFFGDFSSSDAAGNAMSGGYAVLFVTAPCMIFIFFSNLYLFSKMNLKLIYKYVAIANIVGLIILTFIINL